MNADDSEGDVGGDTYDDSAADENDAGINYSAYTAEADNADVGSNANEDDKKYANNYHVNDNTNDDNNVGLDEVPILHMMGKGKIESSVLNKICPV